MSTILNSRMMSINVIIVSRVVSLPNRREFYCSHPMGITKSQCNEVGRLTEHRR